MTQSIHAASAIFKKRHPGIGARPGTLMISDDALKPKVQMVRFNQTNVQEKEIDDVEQLAEPFSDGTVTWVHVQGFGDEQLIRRIGDIFAIHPLALEDIVNMPQRPKTESYDGQILVITRIMRVSNENTIEMEQLSLLFGNGYVLSFQEQYGDELEPVMVRIRTGVGRPIRRSGSDYLSYVILDTVIDGYYPVIEAIGDHLEHLESVVMEDPSTRVLQDLNRTKNMLVNLRRVVWPQRELVNSLVRDETPLIVDEVRVFLRDTYDHCVQTAEVIEMYRDMVTGLMNTYLSSVANRTNEVMKVLTIMASVFIPLTFIAGIYGMNFEHMPELHVRWAYPAIWVAMVGTAGGMLFFFWKRGWIGSQKP